MTSAFSCLVAKRECSCMPSLLEPPDLEKVKHKCKQDSSGCCQKTSQPLCLPRLSHGVLAFLATSETRKNCGATPD